MSIKAIRQDKAAFIGDVKNLSDGWRDFKTSVGTRHGNRV
jgi:hypothetical protein